MKYSAGFTWGTVEAWKCCTESMADTHKFEKCFAFLVFLSGKPESAEKYFCIAIITYERKLYHKEGTCYKSHKLNNILICTVQNWITWGRRFLKFNFCWMMCVWFHLEKFEIWTIVLLSCYDYIWSCISSQFVFWGARSSHINVVTQEIIILVRRCYDISYLYIYFYRVCCHFSSWCGNVK